ncbi:hypothetical protein [Mesorhizobium sp.]|uniref:hypothetical protein n=1 Tax=Mesorhizobium sp. TaxID=1871066 RepID=UPI000FE46001|nr:hypothetical protein [Mesorhizobium sp.]RWE92285.1 MAG: hypothetical protein EOS43_31290 [Mesorhizobium sp.]
MTADATSRLREIWLADTICQDIPDAVAMHGTEHLFRATGVLYGFDGYWFDVAPALAAGKELSILCVSAGQATASRA